MVACVCAHATPCVENREQPVRQFSSSTIWLSWSNSGNHAGQQAPLLPEPSHFYITDFHIVSLFTFLTFWLWYIWRSSLIMCIWDSKCLLHVYDHFFLWLGKNFTIMPLNNCCGCRLNLSSLWYTVESRIWSLKCLFSQTFSPAWYSFYWLASFVDDAFHFVFIWLIDSSAYIILSGLFQSDFFPYIFLNVSFKFLTISWTLVLLKSETLKFCFVFLGFWLFCSLISGVEEYCTHGDVVGTCFLTYLSFFLCVFYTSVTVDVAIHFYMSLSHSLNLF